LHKLILLLNPSIHEDLSSMTVWTILYYTRYVG